MELISGEVFMISSQYILHLLRMLSCEFYMNYWVARLNAIQDLWLCFRVIIIGLMAELSAAKISKMFISLKFKYFELLYTPCYSDKIHILAVDTVRQSGHK